MALTVEKIRSAANDEALIELLAQELESRFPPEMQARPAEFAAALRSAPKGLRAMAAIHALDFSVALDDLTWHFGNNHDEALLEETLLGLKELGAAEAAEVFGAACATMRPHLDEIRGTKWDVDEFLEFLKRTGIQEKMDPLNQRMWKVCEQCGEAGLLSYWEKYAREHPENCIDQ